MLIKFKKVTLENFLSFGPRTEIQLSDRGYTLVEGVNNNPADNAYSNGSGKSSIFDAILYCLTGTTSRGTNKNLINLNTDGNMLVTLDFSVDDTEYEIIRGKDRKDVTTLKFYVNGEDKSSTRKNDTKDIINQYLPDLTESLITSVIILGQGMPNKFTDNTPSGRKGILEKLSNSDFMIDDIKDRISNRKTALLAKEHDVELRLTECTSQGEVYTEQLAGYQKALNGLVEVDKAAVDNSRGMLDVMKAALDEDKAALDDKTTDLSELKTELSKIKDDKAATLKELDGEWSARRQSAQDEVTKNSVLAESLKNEIIRLKSIVDVCPTCGRKLDGVEKPDTSKQEAELTDLMNTLSESKKNRDAIENGYASSLSNITEEFRQKENDNWVNTEALRSEISGLTDMVREKTKEYDAALLEYNTLKQSYDTYSQRKEELTAEIEAINEKLKINDNKTLYNTNERKNVENSLTVVNKMMTIAARDFRGILLANVIDYINKRAKIYCTDIFGTDKMELSLDGNDLNVIYDGKLYENLSGGEKKRLDIICQLSIRDMLSQFSNFSSNILVLDEFTDSLDRTSTEAVLDCLAKRLMDVESTFIVTHMTNLSIPTDSTITVVKDMQGISRVI